MNDETDEVVRLSQAASALFAGKPQAVQGAVLADLLAMFLAGHVVRGGPKATKRVREQILDMHLKMVWRLVPINYENVIAPKLRGAKTSSETLSADTP